jgi:hypothetical protein
MQAPHRIMILCSVNKVNTIVEMNDGTWVLKGVVIMNSFGLFYNKESFVIEVM